MTRAAAERVLRDARERAQAIWGDRLIAAYTIGSLAHGGFSPAVSDLDCALILAAPLEAADAPKVDELKQAVAATHVPLASRLSVFWTSLDGRAGRLPPVDLLDLKEHGELTFGIDVRARLPSPARRDLVIAGARFALQRVGGIRAATYLANPRSLLAAGQLELTKFILYPVRLVFTARTGCVGRNEAAVAHFRQSAPAGPSELAQKALAWRGDPPDARDPAVLGVLANLPALYRIFIDEYTARLKDYEDAELEQAYGNWSAS
jgi:hypothetical protein